MNAILLLIQTIFSGFIPPPHNILDLSNLYIHPTSQMAYTIDPLEVEHNTTYTLVIDERSLGQHLDDIRNYELEIESQYYDFYPFFYDQENKLAYVSFEPKDTLIYIHQIPASFYGSFNIMLYKGTYEDFMSFEHYLTPSITEYTIPIDDLNAPTLTNVPFINTEVLLLEETTSFPKYKLYKEIGAPYYHLFYFELYDRTPPLIYGPQEILVYSSQAPLTDEDILAYFNITNTNTFTISFETNTYLQTQTPGKYQIKIKAVDTSNNTSTYITYIHVIDDSTQEVTLRPYAIETSIFNTLTLEEIYTILDTYLNQLQIPYNTLDITLNTYALSKATPGSYEIYYELHSDDLTPQGILYSVVSHPLEDPFWL